MAEIPMITLTIFTRFVFFSIFLSLMCFIHLRSKNTAENRMLQADRHHWFDNDRPAVLVVSERRSRHERMISSILDSVRISHDRCLTRRIFNNFLSRTHKAYKAIIFENDAVAIKVMSENKEVLDHCRKRKIGLIIFVHSDSTSKLTTDGFIQGVVLHKTGRLVGFQVNPQAQVLNITRANQKSELAFFPDEWTFFEKTPAGALFQPILQSEYHNKDTVKQVAISIHDTGRTDGVEKILFGNSVEFWLHVPLLLDALNYLGVTTVASKPDRYIQIDIDDVFVAEAGTRMKASDVDVRFSLSVLD